MPLIFVMWAVPAIIFVGGGIYLISTCISPELESPFVGLSSPGAGSCLCC